LLLKRISKIKINKSSRALFGTIFNFIPI